MGEVKDRGHKISPASIWYFYFLFQVSPSNHIYDMANSMFYHQKYIHQKRFPKEFLQNYPGWEAWPWGYGYQDL